MRRASFLAVPLIALVCCAASASAAPVDTQSAHLGLRAYRAYLSSVVSRLHASAASDNALIRTVRTDCPKVLAPTAKVKHANATATSLIGQEVGADLVIASFAPDRQPFATFAERMDRLQWSSDRTREHVTKGLADMDAFFQIAPSDLCADAKAFADSGAKAVSPATKSFLASFDQVGNTGLGPVIRTLRRYHPARDSDLVRKLDLIEGHWELRLFDRVTDRAFVMFDALGLGI